MNQNRFRLVFNERVGAWQAVPETARARGKRASSGVAAALATVLLGTSVAAFAEPAANALPVPRLDFVSRGSVSAPVTSGAVMRIDQHSDKAVVNWSSFNVGRDATVRFNQPSSSAAILNRIWDSRASEIYGHLEANGQVYLINRNGILFGRSATVNVASLVASALNISDDLFEAGFLNNPQAGNNPAFFLDSANYDGSTVADAQQVFQAAKVVVGEGATINSVDGGRVMLLAPTVEVAGKVQTPGGQAVIAAGAKVYLAASENENLRGILVEVDPLNPNFSTGDSDGDGKVTIDEAAEVVARRGNVSIAAYAIQVDGKIAASTGATGAGSVFLQGRDSVKAQTDPNAAAYSYAYSNRAGEVTIGSTGRVEVGIENAGTDTLLDSVDAPESRVSVTGSKILLEDGARISARSGTVSMIATTRFDFENGIQRLSFGDTGLNQRPIDIKDVDPGFVLVPGETGSDARIVISRGASIDVSGMRGGEDVGATVSAARNQIDVKFLRAELKDAPLQRNGILYRKDGSFDLGKARDGILRIADLSGYAALVKRSIQERSTDGGTVRLLSQGDVIVDTGAKINVSGGWTRFLSADIVTTVLSANGLLFDIEAADPDLIYTSIATKRTTIPTYDEGADGGTFEVVTRNAVLDGDVDATARVGLYQRQRGAAEPKRGSLIVGGAIGNGDLATNGVEFAAGEALGAAFHADPLNAGLGARAGTLSLDPARLVASGFQNIEIYSNSGISIPAAATWSLPALTSLTLTAVDDIAINRSIRGAGLELTASSTAGAVSVGDGVAIDTSGLWVNDSLALLTGRSPYDGLMALDGGEVTLSASTALVLGTGSVINVSGGGAVDSSGRFTAGDAGAINLAHTGGRALDGGVTLGGNLMGYAFQYGTETGGGGALSLTADDIVVNGTANSSESLVLDDGLFTQGGFSSYALTATWGAVEVGADSRINLARSVRSLGRAHATAGSASEARAGSTMARVNAFVDDPAQLVLSANSLPEDVPSPEPEDRVRVGRVLLNDGSAIRATSGSEVTFSAGRQVMVGASIQAAGGDVSFRIADTVDSNGSDVGYFDDQGIFLSGAASVDVSGYSRVFSNVLGQRSGSVFDAGTINFTANKGYVIAQRGSQLKADGVLDRVNLRNGASLTVASAGGVINVSTREGALIASDMSARGGDATARDGRFHLRLNRDNNDAVALRTGGVAYPTGERVIRVVDSLPTLGAWQVGEAVPGELIATAYVTPVSLSAAGFDNVTLNSDNVVRLETESALSATQSLRIESPVVAVSDGVEGRIEAPHVAFVYDDKDDQVARSVGDGAGVLTVSGNTMDVAGQVGFDNLDALYVALTEDLRLSGVQPNGERIYTGSLTAAGDAHVTARQVYASTNTSFDVDLVTPGASLTIDGTGHVPDTPLSAGARLTLSADFIDQGGVVRAPFGELTLSAAETLTLRDGSITSTSGEGASILFGLLEGSDWVLPYADGSSDVLATAPGKVIKLEAPAVDIQTGAVVDLSGGGELLTYEFTPGSGGSTDVLARPGTYAILPGYDGSYAPIDAAHEAGFDLPAGTTITLGAGSGVPAGTYVLLPGHYALLPGAYTVTRLSGQDMLASETTRMPLGGSVIAGTLSEAAGKGDDRTSRWLVESGALTRERSAFVETNADAFFAERADAAGRVRPRGTQDAGQLVASAARALTLDGDIRFDVEDETDRGGLLDIDANRIAIGAPVADALVISVDQLNASGADSIVIGGRRDIDREGNTTLQVGASEVSLDSPQTLRAGEVVLAATDTVRIDDGSSIEADPDVAIGDAGMTTSGDGALVRVANGGVSVARTGTNSLAGVASVGNARLTGEHVQIDATLSTSISDQAHIDSRAFALGADRITLGDANPAQGVGLDHDALRSLTSADDIVLRSYTSIDFAQSIDLGSDVSPLSALTFDSARVGWTGPVGGVARIVARSVTFTNTTGTTLSDAGARELTGNGGVLKVSAVGSEAGGGVVTVGEGGSSIRGFDATEGLQLSAERGMVFAGSGQLSSAGNVLITAPTMVAEGGADTGIEADGLLRVDASNVTDGAAELEAAPGRLRLAGASVFHGGSVELPSGRLTLEANSGDVVLVDGAHLSVASLVRNFDGSQVAFDAGTVELIASGNVRVDSGATVDVSGQVDADAGTLAVTAIQGAATLDGQLMAGTGSADARGGVFKADLGQLSSLDALAAATHEFTEGRHIRLREGDLVLGAATRLQAASVSLGADRGDVTVDGVIDARGADGGEVQLAARRAGAQGGRVALNGQILANATGADGSGGRVELAVSADTAAGETDTRIALDAGAVVMTAGRNAQGNAMDDGTLILSAPVVAQASDSTINVENRGASLSGMSAVEARAMIVQRTSGDLSVDALWQTRVSGSLQSLHNQYAQAIATRVAGSSGVAVNVTPGIDAQATGDITLASNLDFNAGNGSTWRFGNADELGGLLSLRAAGDVNVAQSISDGFASASSSTVTTRADGWDYRIVAGADLSAADALAVAGDGDLSLSGAAVIRSGTGDIEIAASGNVLLPESRNAIYSAGRLVTDVPAFAKVTGGRGGSGLSPVFTTDGGSVNVHADGDVLAAAGPLSPSQWLWRQGAVVRTRVTESPAYWVEFANVAQVIGALGGGGVSVTAGGNLVDLAVAVPQTGVATTSEGVKTWGGGTLNVMAGGDLVRGDYLLGAGDGTIRVDGRVRNEHEGTSADGVFALRTMLYVGDAQLTLNALGNVSVQSVMDPALLPLVAANGSRRLRFSSMSADSAVDIRSAAGGVTLGNPAQEFVGNGLAIAASSVALNDAQDLGAEWIGFQLLPASVSVISMLESVVMDSGSAPTYMMPAPSGQLALMAGTSVEVAEGQAFGLRMYDMDASLIGSLSNALETDDFSQVFVASEGAVRTTSNRLTRALHAGDDDPARIVAVNGDISGSFVISKAAEVVAGGDVRNLRLITAHDDHLDTTRVEAGGDIVVTEQREAATNARLLSDAGIIVHGPGELLVRAGGDVNLGTGEGIRSVGNSVHSVLPDGGANVRVIAGRPATIDAGAFALRYLTPGSEARAELVAWLNASGHSVADTDAAVAAFATLDESAQIEFASHWLRQAFISTYLNGAGDRDYTRQWSDYATRRGLPADAASAGDRDLDRFRYQVLWQELIAAGSAAEVVKADAEANPGKYSAAELSSETLYARGFEALDLAGLSKPFGINGDARLVFSQVKTEDGGNLDILVPGGSLDVGLVNQPAGFSKSASELGIVATRGDVNILVDDSIAVNQSRVFALDGGDILMWASTGDVGAGSGERTALSAPPPVLTIDRFTGAVKLEYQGATSGSGIATIFTDASITSGGNVRLYAPAGIIDAGEAGIQSSGNLELGAIAVQGADLIVSAGSSNVAAAPSVPQVASVSNPANDAAAAANDLIESEPTAAGQGGQSSLLTVEVLAVGPDCEGSERNADECRQNEGG
ncbi:two-partner secretion domain-containing protein [Nitrogeniibacter aestuarii]|uniref:two-partner secretion domain-containing protein n=1 Tax=Nitrogeniibacter aestuarii TaxID=2815343 RepID=UPI001D11CC97|nr:filamentous haemagglutinin family protein [Nitrogeniibacter aestuarii]